MTCEALQITYLCNLCANQQVQIPDYVDGNLDGEEEEQRWQRFLRHVSLAPAAHAQPPQSSVEEGVEAIDRMLEGGKNEDKENENKDDLLETASVRAVVTAEEYR